MPNLTGVIRQLKKERERVQGEMRKTRMRLDAESKRKHDIG